MSVKNKLYAFAFFFYLVQVLGVVAQLANYTTAMRLAGYVIVAIGAGTAALAFARRQKART